MTDDHPDPILEALMRQRPGEDLSDTVAELLVGLRPAWHQHAACRGVGPERFYLEQGASAAPARAMCAACEVTTECTAAGHLEHHGIWAGESPKERRLVRSSGRLRPPAA
jgi:hypothetical protein